MKPSNRLSCISILLGIAVSACSDSDPVAPPGTSDGGGQPPKAAGGSSGGGDKASGGAAGASGAVGTKADGSGGSGGITQTGGSGGTGTVGPVFDCFNQSPDTLAANIAPGWELVESVVVEQELQSKLRGLEALVVKNDGRVVGVNSFSNGLVEEWGTWPKIGPTGKTVDFLLPEHRKRVDDANEEYHTDGAVFDEGTLIVTYDDGDPQDGKNGGVFVDNGTSAKTLPACFPSSARRIGDRLVVYAAGLIDPTNTKKLKWETWSTDINSPASPLKLVQTAERQGVNGIHFLGGDVLFYATNFEVGIGNEGYFSVNRFSKEALKGTGTTLTLPGAAASIYNHNSGPFRSVEIKDGILVLMESEERDENGNEFPPSVEVLRDKGGTLVPEVLLNTDGRCTEIGRTFAVSGEPVIEVRMQLRDNPQIRLLRLRPRSNP